MTDTAPRIDLAAEADESIDEADLIRWTNNPYIGAEEGRAMFDDAARRYMGISGEKFIQRWEAGEYDAIADSSDHWYVGFLGSLIPFARIDS